MCPYCRQHVHVPGAFLSGFHVKQRLIVKWSRFYLGIDVCNVAGLIWLSCPALEAATRLSRRKASGCQLFMWRDVYWVDNEVVDFYFMTAVSFNLQRNFIVLIPLAFPIESVTVLWLGIVSVWWAIRRSWIADVVRVQTKCFSVGGFKGKVKGSCPDPNISGYACITISFIPCMFLLTTAYQYPWTAHTVFVR